MFSSCSEFLLYLLFLEEIVEGSVEALLVLAEVLDCLQVLVGWSGTLADDSLARGIALTTILKLNVIGHFVRLLHWCVGSLLD